MADITTLADGVAELVQDGSLVALEGFTHLIPFAAGHEIVRQGRRRLTLARMTPDVVSRRLHAPNCVLIYESGTIGSKPRVPPLFIGDARAGRFGRYGRVRS